MMQFTFQVSEWSTSYDTVMQARARVRRDRLGQQVSPAGSPGNWGELRPCSRWWAAALTP